MSTYCVCSPIRRVCRLFYTIVQERFPEFSVKAIGSFFMLRFCCPSIVAPESFGIIEQTPNPDTRRVLVLVAKVLQNVANGVEFGFKESYMEPLNPFIRSNLTPTFAFFESLASPLEDETPHPISVTHEDVFFDLLNVHKTFTMYIEKILASPDDRSEKAKVTRDFLLLLNSSPDTSDLTSNPAKDIGRNQARDGS